MRPFCSPNPWEFLLPTRSRLRESCALSVRGGGLVWYSIPDRYVTQEKTAPFE